MRQKLLELAEILKQKPEIKERLERLTFGCWISTDEAETEEFVRIISSEKEGVWTEPTKYNSDFFKIEELKTGIGMNDDTIKIIGHEPAHHDVLEYLGEEWSMDYLHLYCEGLEYKNIALSPGPLSDQSDEKLDEIISLLKTVGKK